MPTPLNGKQVLGQIAHTQAPGAGSTVPLPPESARLCYPGDVQPVRDRVMAISPKEALFLMKCGILFLNFRKYKF